MPNAPTRCHRNTCIPSQASRLHSLLCALADFFTSPDVTRLMLSVAHVVSLDWYKDGGTLLSDLLNPFDLDCVQQGITLMGVMARCLTVSFFLILFLHRLCLFPASRLSFICHRPTSSIVLLLKKMLPMGAGWGLQDTLEVPRYACLLMQDAFT